MLVERAGGATVEALLAVGWAGAAPVTGARKLRTVVRVRASALDPSAISALTPAGAPASGSGRSGSPGGRSPGDSAGGRTGSGARSGGGGAAARVLGVLLPISEASLRACWKLCVRAFWAASAVLIRSVSMVWAPPVVNLTLESDDPGACSAALVASAGVSVPRMGVRSMLQLDVAVRELGLTFPAGGPGGGEPVTVSVENASIEAHWNPAACTLSVSVDAAALSCVGAPAPGGALPSAAVAAARAPRGTTGQGGMASLKLTGDPSRGALSSLEVKLRLPPEGAVFSTCALGALARSRGGGSPAGTPGGEGARAQAADTPAPAARTTHEISTHELSEEESGTHFFRGNFLFPSALVTLVNFAQPGAFYSFGLKGSLDASPSSAATSLALNILRKRGTAPRQYSPVTEEDVEVSLRAAVTPEQRVCGGGQLGNVALRITSEDLTWVRSALPDLAPAAAPVPASARPAGTDSRSATGHGDMLGCVRGTAGPSRAQVGRPWSPRAGEPLPQAGSVVCLRDVSQGGLFLAFDSVSGRPTAVALPGAPGAEAYFRVHHSRLPKRRTFKPGGVRGTAETAVMFEHLARPPARAGLEQGPASNFLAGSMTSAMDLELRPDRSHQNGADLHWRVCLAPGSPAGSPAQVRCCRGDSALRLGRDEAFHLDPCEHVRGCELVVVDEALWAATLWGDALKVPRPVSVTATVFSYADEISGAPVGPPLVRLGVSAAGWVATADLSTGSCEAMGEITVSLGVLPNTGARSAPWTLHDSVADDHTETHQVMSDCKLGVVCWMSDSQFDLHCRLGHDILCRCSPEQLEALQRVAAQAGFDTEQASAGGAATPPRVAGAVVPAKDFRFSLWGRSLAVELDSTVESATSALGAQVLQLQAAYASSSTGGLAAALSVGQAVIDTGMGGAGTQPCLLRGALGGAGEGDMLSLAYSSVSGPSGLTSISLDCDLRPLQIHLSEAALNAVSPFAPPLLALMAPRAAGGGPHTASSSEALHVELVRVGSVKMDVTCARSAATMDKSGGVAFDQFIPPHVLDAVWALCEGSAGGASISSAPFTLLDVRATAADLSVAVVSYLSKQALYSMAKNAALNEVRDEPLRKGLVKVASAFMDSATQSDVFYPKDLSDLNDRNPQDCSATKAAACEFGISSKSASKAAGRRRAGPLTPLRAVWRGCRGSVVWVSHVLLSDLRQGVAAAGWALVFSSVSDLSEAALAGAELGGLSGAGDAFATALAHMVVQLPDAASRKVGGRLMAASSAGLMRSGGGCAEIEMSRPVTRSDATYVEAYIQALVDAHCALMGSQYDGFRVLVNLSAMDFQTITLTNLPALKASREELLNLLNDTLTAAGLLSPSGRSSATSDCTVAETGGGTLAARMRGVSASRRKSPRRMLLALGRSVLEKVVVIAAVSQARQKLPLHRWTARFLYRVDGPSARAIGSGEAVPLEKTSNKRSLFVLRRGFLSVVLGIFSRRVGALVPPGVPRRIVSACILSSTVARRANL